MIKSVASARLLERQKGLKGTAAVSQSGSRREAQAAAQVTV